MKETVWYEEVTKDEIKLFMFDNRRQVDIGVLELMEDIGYEFVPNKKIEQQGLHLLPKVKQQILYYMEVFDKKYLVEDKEAE